MKILITGGSGFIGTNAVSAFLAEGHSVVNVDRQAPLDPAHRPFWHDAEILDASTLQAIFRETAPDVVIHFAARTDCDEDTTVEEGYRSNTDGTQNVLDAIKATPSVERAIITSSQFVCGPGYLPKSDEDYRPVTVYGESKVITERLTRAANLRCTWTLVRPTNIWGPWHLRYRREFWKVVSRGWYVHPGGAPVVRGYGYVGNLVHQIQRILELPREAVHEQVFYLGDPPDDILHWVNAFSNAFRGVPVRVIPRFLLRIVGLAGDVITAVTGKPFYLTTSRYRSMTSDYLVDMSKTFNVLGKPLIPLEEGVEASVSWYRRYENVELPRMPQEDGRESFKSSPETSDAGLPV